MPSFNVSNTSGNLKVTALAPDGTALNGAYDVAVFIGFAGDTDAAAGVSPGVTPYPSVGVKTDFIPVPPGRYTVNIYPYARAIPLAIQSVPTVIRPGDILDLRVTLTTLLGDLTAVVAGQGTGSYPAGTIQSTVEIRDIVSGALISTASSQSQGFTTHFSSLAAGNYTARGAALNCAPVSLNFTIIPDQTNTILLTLPKIS